MGMDGGIPLGGKERISVGEAKIHFGLGGVSMLISAGLFLEWRDFC